MPLEAFDTGTGFGMRGNADSIVDFCGVGTNACAGVAFFALDD